MFIPAGCLAGPSVLLAHMVDQCTATALCDAVMTTSTPMPVEQADGSGIDRVAPGPVAHSRSTAPPGRGSGDRCALKAPVSILQQDGLGMAPCLLPDNVQHGCRAGLRNGTGRPSKNRAQAAAQTRLPDAGQGVKPVGIRQHLGREHISAGSRSGNGPPVGLLEYSFRGHGRPDACS